MDLVADSFVSTYNRFKYVDFAYSNSVTETKIISRSAHHISGDFMSEVFTDTSYITLAITISILYFLRLIFCLTSCTVFEANKCYYENAM